ncbi:MAG: hypothetical protein ACXW3M_08540 [Rhodoplanes sp.]
MNADETLFMTDTEIIRRLGVPEKTARAAIQELDRHRAFPPKDPLMGNAATGRQSEPFSIAGMALRSAAHHTRSTGLTDGKTNNRKGRAGPSVAPALK